MFEFPSNINKIMTPPIDEITNLIINKEKMISFGQGSPFYSPNAEIMESFWTKIKFHPLLHQYSPDFGFKRVREIVADSLSEDYESRVSYKNVILTSGANNAFFNLIATCTKPGDEVIILTPYYFNHFMALQILNLVPIEMNVDKNYQINIDLINEKINHKTKAIVIINPNNPTGAVFKEKSINELLEICERYKLLLINDETYSKITFDNEKIVSCYTKGFHQRLIRIGSFSKVYGIPGWRIGYIILPDSFILNFMKIQDTVTISPPSISQLFVEFLLQTNIDLIKEYADQIIESRKTMLNFLEKSSFFEVIPTTGAFYFFVKLQHTDLDGRVYAKRLASDFSVLVIPGIAFGRNYNNYIRFSYASVDKNQIEEGFNLIRLFNSTL